MVASAGGSLEDGEAAIEAACNTAASSVPVYFFVFFLFVKQKIFKKP